MIGRREGGVEGRCAREAVSLTYMMWTTIFSWNIRGMGVEAKGWEVRDMLRRWKIDLFSLQEMTLQKIEYKLMLDLWDRRQSEHIHKPVEGQSGGILVAWDSNALEVLESFIGVYSVSVLCKKKRMIGCGLSLEFIGLVFRRPQGSYGGS